MFHVDSNILSSSVPSVPGPASIGIGTGIGISDRRVDEEEANPGGLFIMWKHNEQGDGDTMNTEVPVDAEADADAKRKAKNRESSARSRRRKIESTVKLKKQEAELEAQIKRREDAQQQQEYEAAELERGNVNFHELEQYFAGLGDRGREEWGKVLARIACQRA